MAFEDKRRRIEAALLSDKKTTKQEDTTEERERRVQTSMTLRGELVKKARAEADEQNTTLSRLVENILIDHFANRDSK